MRKISIIMAIIYILFISLFAFDEIGVSFVGFMIHLIPSFFLTLALLISLNKPRIGGYLYFFLAGFTFFFFKTYLDFTGFTLITAPIIVLGVLFFRLSLKKTSS